MKKIFYLIIPLLLCLLNLQSHVHAQKQGQALIDSILQELPKAKEDTNKVKLLNDLSWENMLVGNYDTALYYARNSLHLAEKIVYKKGASAAYNTISVVYINLSDYPKALEYFQKALSIDEQLGNKSYIATIHGNIGLVYAALSDYPKALEYYQKALSIDEQLGDKSGMGIHLSNIGNVYIALSDYPKALEYYQKSLKINEELDIKLAIAANLGNIGIVYSSLSDYPKALEYYQKALSINEQLGNKSNMALNLGSIGDVYADLSDYPKALEYFQKALSIYEALGGKEGIANNLYNIGIAYLDAPDNLLPQMGIKPTERFTKVYEYANRSLQIATEIGDVEQQKGTWEILSKAYEKEGNLGKAYEAYKNYIILRDSIVSEEVKDQITRKEMQYEFDKKEAVATAEHNAEIRKQKIIRNSVVGGLAVMLLFSIVVYRQRNRIGKEKKRSEELLLNILPEETAAELKEKGYADAKHFDEVTVLFTDFKGFTQISEKLSPQELVKELNACFSVFDHICEKYDIEKIKTIGDAYMAAGGLPTPNKTHPQDVVKAALEMRDFMEGKTFAVRVGIHTGTVVAGIVGVKKFAYDIWGDTVNTAARMESSGEAGKVNISDATYQLVKDNFACTHRGKITAKGKGEIDMYFVTERL